MDIKALQEWAHKVAKEKGWYDPPKSVAEMVLMTHGELSEAIEELRVHDPDYVYFSDFGAKPEGFGVELADAMIRICDLAEFLGLDLAELCRVKMQYNETRPRRHGNKAL